MTVITLLTDFGIKDGNVGVMKGVIWGIAPHAQIADLSHTIGPQDVAEGALVLWRSAPYFPRGAIHIAVVDPGVGTARRPMAARLGPYFFVLPDNGLITLMLDHARRQHWLVEMVALNRPQFWLTDVSHVFHGRDIFAPAGAHLANGVPLLEMGASISDPVRLELPQPQPTPEGLSGQIIHIDHFGSLSTNIRREHLEGKTLGELRIAGETIRGMVQTFGERPPGELIALFGSTGSLIVAVVNGSAAQRLGAKMGDPVEVTW